MKRKMGIRWHLRDVMAANGMWKPTDLIGPLAERGVVLSREQIFRLVTGQPERLNVYVLAALCDILACTPNDLIEPVAERKTTKKVASGGSNAADVPLRPVRARVSDRPRRPG